MRACSLLVACALTGCSFVGVRGPVHTAVPTQDPKSIKCTDSSLLPSVDAVLGSIGVGAAIFGSIVDQTDAHTDLPDHFTKYYAGPLVVLGLAYLWSASFGTNRVEACTDARAAVIPAAVVTPIDMTGVKQADPDSGD